MDRRERQGIMKFTFFTPTCNFGAGVSQQAGEILASWGCKKAMCVFDKGVNDAGIVAPILRALRDAGLEVVEFGDVIADPTIEVVEMAGICVQRENVDSIVAIGGGSSIDAAKAANVFATNPGELRDYFGLGLVKNAGLPLIAIPTTAGTGSEMTCIAVVTDVQNKRKVGMADPKMAPALALLDPVLLQSLPKTVTAATGMDALAHAVESMTHVAANPMADSLNVGAIKLITQNLQTCIEDGQNIEARSNMLLAAAMAGMGFGNTGCHLGHGFAHAMGSLWHLPHGTACALALPYAVLHCGYIIPGQIRAIAEAMGLSLAADATPGQMTNEVSEAIFAFSRAMGIPTLRELGIEQKDLPRIVEASMAEPVVQLSPVPLTEVQCRTYYADMFSR